MTPTETKIYFLYNYLHAKNAEKPTYQEIADILKISKVTVWEHVQNIISKGYLIKLQPLKSRQVS